MTVRMYMSNHACRGMDAETILSDGADAAGEREEDGDRARAEIEELGKELGGCIRERPMRRDQHETVETGRDGEDVRRRWRWWEQSPSYT
jgi:hypothetical protein